MTRTAISILALSVGLGAAACVVNNSDDDEGTGGGDGTGGAATGGGGTGGEAFDECQGVPRDGECIDESTIQACLVNETPGEQPSIITVDCDANELCEEGLNGAACVLQGECRAGQSRCVDSTTLQICDGSTNEWLDSDCGTAACVSQPGLGAQCLSASAGSGIFLRGKLEYEFLVPNAGLTDFDPAPQSEGAVDFFVTVYDTSDPEASLDDQLLGMALTSFGGDGMDPGEFEVELDGPVNENTFVYFWPILFDQTGQPRMGIAKAQSDDAIAQASDEYWFWGFETCAEGTGECGVTDIGTLTIDVANNSGAAHIYQWMDFGIFRFEGLFPSGSPQSFAVFWDPSTEFNCGNCFVPPLGGGATVTYDTQNDLADHFDSTVNISGTLDSPTHWAKSVINHELGHWTMSSYTKSPGEGGVHFVNEASKPGLSYSEGYATFVGQTQISNSPSDNDPIYFTKKNGTSFWVDLSDNTWSGGALDKPDPNGPQDQFVNENVIASMFWSFWASSNAEAPQSLGEAPVFDPLATGRLINNETWNRGYPTVDMLDYLDAMKCGSFATDAQIEAVASSVGFPWDNSPSCP